jgi:protein TonB
VRTGTVVVSLVLHAGVAFMLLTRAETKARHRAISVAVPDEVKKKVAPPKPPPPPPRPVAHVTARPAPKVEAPEPVVARTSAPRAAPVQTAVALSNADLAPGGIAVAGTPKLEKAAPVKVAGVDQGAPRHRLHEPGSPNQAEEACDEEPTKPVPVYKTEIEYTAAARAEGVEGRLLLALTIGADGSVTDVAVLSSVQESLDAAAIATAKTWRFKPALKCGKPVAGGLYKYAQRFELAD